MEIGSTVVAMLLRAVGWILLFIASVLIVLVALRAFGFQDMPTYTQDIIGILVCVGLAIICRGMAGKFSAKPAKN